jgi:hypothetical protein
MKRLFNLIWALLIAALVTACGGGGGGSGTVAGPEPAVALAVSIPADGGVVVPLGGTSDSFVISGGRQPYSASSQDPRVAVPVLSGNRISVGGVALGTVRIVVRDAFGSVVEFSAVVGPLTPLITTAASAVTLIENSTAIYSIRGGAAPYTATSSAPGVASVSVLSNALSVRAIARGTANVVVTDARGSTVLIAVTVEGTGPANLFTTAPDTINVVEGATTSFGISGGRAPYTAVSDTPATVTASVNGNAFSVVGVRIGTARVIVRDALGASASVTVNVTSATGGAGNLFTTAPTTLNMVAGTQQSFTVSGGRSPYSANSSAVAVATGQINGSSLTIGAVSAGTAQVVVVDSAGANVVINVTVTATTAPPGNLFTNAPSSITVIAGTPAQAFTVSGGRAPYTANSSAVAVATAQIAGNALSITPRSPGSAQIVVVDSAGASVVINITVTAPVATPLAVVPAAATGVVNDQLVFRVEGGTAPYQISTNNPAVAIVTLNGSTINAALRQVGNTSVTITDSLGARVTLALTVTADTLAFRISPNALTLDIDTGGNLTFFVFGGTGTYTVFSSNLDLIRASVSGQTITAAVQARPAGFTANAQVTLTLVDSAGAIATTVITLTP